MPDKARKSKQVRQLHVLEQDGTRSILNVVMHGNTTVLRGILCDKTVTTTLLYVGIFTEKELKVISYMFVIHGSALHSTTGIIQSMPEGSFKASPNDDDYEDGYDND